MDHKLRTGLTNDGQQRRPGGGVLDEKYGDVESDQEAVLDDVLEDESAGRHDQQHHAQVEDAAVVGVATGRAEQRVAHLVEPSGRYYYIEKGGKEAERAASG